MDFTARRQRTRRPRLARRRRRLGGKARSLAEISYLSQAWGGSGGVAWWSWGTWRWGSHKARGPKSPITFPTHQTLVFMILFLEKRRMEGGRHKGLKGSQWLGLEVRGWGQG